MRRSAERLAETIALAVPEKRTGAEGEAQPLIPGGPNRAARRAQLAQVKRAIRRHKRSRARSG